MTVEGEREREKGHRERICEKGERSRREVRYRGCVFFLFRRK